MTDHERVLAAMNGPGDRAKLSASATKAQKKAALAAALEAKKKSAKKSAKNSGVPLKKASANKKVVRKTMKAGKKR